MAVEVTTEKVIRQSVDVTFTEHRVELTRQEVEFALRNTAFENVKIPGDAKLEFDWDPVDERVESLALVWQRNRRILE